MRTVIDVAHGYRLTRIATETNGVGQMPSDELARQLRFRFGKVVPVTTTAASKEDGFGAIKVMLGQGRLALPRHPALLAQLSSLEYEERDSGTLRIEVPPRSGHDDIEMALMLAVSEADVASWAPGRRISFPTGDLPKTQLVPDRDHCEPPIHTVREGEERPVERLYSFARARQHPDYTPGRR